MSVADSVSTCAKLCTVLAGYIAVQFAASARVRWMMKYKEIIVQSDMMLLVSSIDHWLAWGSQ